MKDSQLIPIATPGLLRMERRSETWLRDGAEVAGYPVTHAQFVRYRDADLLPPPGPDGRYPEWAASSLVEIRRFSSSVRPLPRRTIRLRANYLLFPVPAARLLRAMLDTLPTVRQRVRKFRRVAALLDPSARRPTGSRPTFARFRELLEQANPQQIEMWAPGWYAMASSVIPARFAPDPSPVDDLPLEELVIFIALSDLDVRERAAGGAQSG